MNDNAITITLPPDNRWLPYAHESIARYGEMVGFSTRLEEMLSSSVMEAFEELFRSSELAGITDPVTLRLEFKGEAVITDLEYNGNIPLNPHEADEYEVPDTDTELMDVSVDTLWLHMIRQRMDRVFFKVRGSRHILRMVKYHREAGKERQAWVMALKPALRKKIVLHLDNQDDEHPSSVLQNPGGGVLQLGPSETFIVQRIDGETSLHDIYMDHIDALGLTSPTRLASLYEKLESLKMLADPEEEAKSTRLKALIRSIINPNFSIPRADAFVSIVHARTKFLQSHAGIIVLLVIGLSGVIPLVQNLPRFTEVVIGLEEQLFRQPLIILPLYLLTLVHIVLHELGHGITCKHFGGMVPRLGIMFYLGSFIFYCDTTASLTFPRKRDRILVSLGGPIISFAILGAGIWLAGWMSGVNETWESIFVAFSLLNMFVLAMNFNPFIRMDAYYMLIDYTGIPNLREKSFKFLKRKTLGWLGFGSREDTRVSPRERRIFWWYGVLGSMVTVIFLALPLLRLNYLLTTESALGGRLVFALIIVSLLIMRMAKLAFDMIKSMRYRDYRIQ